MTAKVHTLISENQVCEPPKSGSLDTLAQLGTNSPDVTDLGSYRKRARAKYFTNNLAIRLATIEDSFLKKSYFNSYYCSSSLVQKDKTFTSKYCGNRWCTVCNRIKTAQLINGYSSVLEELPDKHFVTLTLRNVDDEELKPTLDYMLKTVKQIQDNFKKKRQRGLQSWQLVGLRKLECTYNPILNSYHPHFHFIVSGKESADVLVSEWLSRVKTADIKGQNVKPCRPGINHELFKYFSKIITKVDGKNMTYIGALDVIFTSIWGLRTFQSIGIKKHISEDILEVQSQVVVDAESERDYWVWAGSDWNSLNTNKGLTGYKPSDKMDELVANMV